MAKWVVSGVLALLGSVPAAAALYQVPILEDTFVREAAPNTNYGVGQPGVGALAVSGVDSVNGSGSPVGRADAFIKFSLAALFGQLDLDFPGGWQIEAITLRLQEQSQPNNPIYAWGPLEGGTLDINWIAADGWVDTTLTWNTAGGFLGGPMQLLVDDHPTVGRAESNIFTDHFIALPLAGDFLADVLAGGMVSLYLTTQDPGAGFQCASANNNTLSRRPYLIVEASAQVIPEPGALGLVALGLTALARSRRRGR